MKVLLKLITDDIAKSIQSFNAPTIGSLETNLNDQSEQPISSWQVIAALNSFILSSENIPNISSAVLLTLLGTTLNFLSPYLLAKSVDLLASKDENLPLLTLKLPPSTLIGLMVASYALSHIIPNLRDQIMLSVTARNTKKMNERINRHLLQKSLSYHINTSFSDQFYLVQKGSSANVIGDVLLTTIAPRLMEISVASVILSIQYGMKMGIGLAGMIILLGSLSALKASSVLKTREQSLKSGNEAYDSFYSVITNYKTMRDFCKYDETQNNLIMILNKLADDEYNAAITPLKIGLGHIIISRMGMFLASVYIGLGVKSGKYSVQQFLVLIGYFNQLSNILPVFGHGLNQLFASYPDLKFVFGELRKADEVIDLHPEKPLSLLPDIAPSIEFENVTFSYSHPSKSNHSVLLFQDLSFKIKPGHKVAFVSESGAGKTTIFNLLYGYYKPTSGIIKINGQDISQISLKSLQENIVVFGQNPNLFQGSIRENIVYGAKNSKKIDDYEIWAIASSVNLYDFLKSFPNELDTDVGEEGKKLSGGQQQKVAILRGLMKKSQIRLLDEITSSCDSQSASQILKGICDNSKDTTSLFITHKLTEVQFFDYIFIINNGKVIAGGTHDDLSANCEFYKNLWESYNKKINTEETSYELYPNVTNKNTFFSSIDSIKTIDYVDESLPIFGMGLNKSKND